MLLFCEILLSTCVLPYCKSTRGLKNACSAGPEAGQTFFSHEPQEKKEYKLIQN